jgi:hypothetical protein
MTRLALLVLLIAAAAAATCPPETEPWTVTMDTRTVSCCARHILPDLTSRSLDGVTLWCPHLPRPSLWVGAWTNARTGLPGMEQYPGHDIPGTACRAGPRLRRVHLSQPRPFPLRPRQRHCCPVTIARMRGPVAQRDPTGSLGYVQGQITGFTGIGWTHCKQGRAIVIQGIKADEMCPLPDQLNPSIGSVVNADGTIVGSPTLSLLRYFNRVLPKCGGELFSGDMPWTENTLQGALSITGACTGTLDVARRYPDDGNPFGLTMTGALNCACCGVLPVDVVP